jgi:hypothetical protein
VDSIDIISEIKQAYARDSMTADILAQSVDASVTRKQLQQYRVVDGLIMYDSRVFVPNDRPLKCLILFECHDAPMSGHFGRMKTSDLVTRRFYWPNMNEDIMQYVRACVRVSSARATNLVTSYQLAC